MTKDEKRAYAKGYAAGRKKTDRDARRDRNRTADARRENRMWVQVFCAALQGTLVSRSWRTGDASWKWPDDFAIGCGQIADAALEKHRWRA